MKQIVSHLYDQGHRRLAYVGITRAQRYLYLSWAKSRLLYGKKRQLPNTDCSPVNDRLIYVVDLHAV